MYMKYVYRKHTKLSLVEYTIDGEIQAVFVGLTHEE